MALNEEKAIPEVITSAAVSMLAPYKPGLTSQKLIEALAFKPEAWEDELKSRLEASTNLHISLPTLDRMLASGELTRVNVRGRVFIRKSEIDRIISGKAVV